MANSLPVLYDQISLHLQAFNLFEPEKNSSYLLDYDVIWLKDYQLQIPKRKEA